jgi:hypothetical protein
MGNGMKGTRLAPLASCMLVLLLGVTGFALSTAGAKPTTRAAQDGFGSEGCAEPRDPFRDLDGDGCPERVVSAGNVRLSFTARGAGERVRVTVTSLTLRADRKATVLPVCRPRCKSVVTQLGGRKARIALEPKTFRVGALVSIRVVREGRVGRFFGYRITSRGPRYEECLLRSLEGRPKRCRT